VAFMKDLPEGESRDRLLNETSALDVIAEVMRRALDSCLTHLAIVRRADFKLFIRKLLEIF
jgi:hypothetical protein